MKLIVGLGNPGPEYRLTRHNAGRLLIEQIAGWERVSLKGNKKIRLSVSAPFSWGEEIVIAYPDSYMNLSGEAVAAAVLYYGLRADRDLLILVDELALPFGRLRLRPSGSDGGHNGLRSVIDCLGSRDFARLRMGIGHPSDKAGLLEPKDYVLAPFDGDEQASLEPFLRRGYEACRFWSSESIEKAMSVVNAFKS